MGSSKTQKNFKNKQKNVKNTEKRENTNTWDLSKVLPAEAQRQGLQMGSELPGVGAWQLHLATADQKQCIRYALPPGSTPAPSPPPLPPKQVAFTFLSQRPFFSSVTCSLSPFLQGPFFCLCNFLNFLLYLKKKVINYSQGFAAIYSATLISYACPTAPDRWHQNMQVLDSTFQQQAWCFLPSGVTGWWLRLRPGVT